MISQSNYLTKAVDEANEFLEFDGKFKTAKIHPIGL